MRRLIVNADDFGLTRGVNRAIVESHRDGIVTSSTLMANGQAFEDAIAQAKSASRLSVGCHVVLVDGSPVLGGQQASTLFEKKADGGRFYDGLGAFALRANRSLAGSTPTRLKLKLRHKFANCSRPAFPSPTWIRTSTLTSCRRYCGHCYGRLAHAACRRCVIPSDRFAFRSWRNTRVCGSGYSQGYRSEPPRRKAFPKLCYRQRGYAYTTDGTVGIVRPPAPWMITSSRDIVESLPEGTWEFVCHPGYNDSELDSVRTRLRESRAVELRLLTSPKALELLVRSGVQLISYRDLA